MRRIKFWVFTAIAVLTLFSIRDKEIVLNVPTGKPLIAEAYHAPDPSQNLSLPASAPTMTSSTTSQQGNNSFTTSNNASLPNYLGENIADNTSSSSAPIAADSAVSPVSSPAQNQNQPAPQNNTYYGLGTGVYDPSAASNNPAPATTPSNSAPVIKSFSPNKDNLTVNWGTSIFF